MKPYLDTDTLRFILFEVAGLQKVLAQPRFADHDRATVEMLLNAVMDYSDKELHPYFREMDEYPAHYENGEIIVHSQVKRCIALAGEMGLIAAPFDYDVEGMQMPYTVISATAYIQEAANNHLPNYAGLTRGAANLILHFGDDHLKKTFVPSMLAGNWVGTMCLTEPQAGSSLSDITSTAVPERGYYKIRGQKIFISGGDFKGVENVVHLLLARIEGAPAGTRGISLFVVPKHRPGEDGELIFNDVNTIGDFQKMGQRGYCTTHLSFGDKRDCKAWLVGEPNQGLKYMFMMMNEARIAVGRGAAAIAMAASRESLQYARERPQGRLIQDSGTKNPEQEQTLIINHPDVRRMLLLQKAITEGALCLILRSSVYHDLSENHEDPKERERYGLLLDLLTPVAKTYPAEKGLVSVSNGLQVLGGYGYCQDFILQQYFRDIRIFSIYEGTTGIQSLDLLGRKITMKGGEALCQFFGEVKETIQNAQAFPDLEPYAGKLEEALELTTEVTSFLTGFAKEGKFTRFLADASVFMEFFGTLVVGWLWLDMACEAHKQLSRAESAFRKEFYLSKVNTMKFYYRYEMSALRSLADTLMSGIPQTLEEEKEILS